MWDCAKFLLFAFFFGLYNHFWLPTQSPVGLQIKDLTTNLTSLQEQIKELQDAHLRIYKDMERRSLFLTDGFSRILEPDHYPLLETWLMASGYGQPKLQLCFRKHQNLKIKNRKRFSKNCDRQGPMLVLVRSKALIAQPSKVFGGFTQVGFDKRYEGFVQDWDAWVFSLTGKRRFKVQVASDAIYQSRDTILGFGKDFQIKIGDTPGRFGNPSLFPHSYNDMKAILEVEKERGSYLEMDQYLTGGRTFQVDRLEVYIIHEYQDIQKSIL